FFTAELLRDEMKSGLFRIRGRGFWVNDRRLLSRRYLRRGAVYCACLTPDGSLILMRGTVYELPCRKEVHFPACVVPRRDFKTRCIAGTVRGGFERQPVQRYQYSA